MPRPEFPIDVDRQLVWMTCGSDAGYQILLSPANSQASWLDILESAFPGLEIGQAGIVKAAAVFHEGSPALALAFFDPERCDASSRPVKHFLLFLGASDEMLGKGPQLVVPALLSQLEPAYQVLWEATRYSREADIAKYARKKMAGQSVHLDLSAKVAKPPKVKEKKVVTNPSFTGEPELADDGEALGFPRWAMWLIAAVMTLLAVGVFILQA
ncbi:hypothetical protein EV700_0620 [Fluviicoccus keumensis]|uniref:Uncharacterized protein n=1 Tax=Fluviicoccus keumensis TaxID=1435465 RepID=A0A4Q7ZCC7_9GAMM|nr:hypothetical protein [Fluviicoccus keumensis]RZU47653.1 hypothetical protein EV700_0620 [Fluviicoccus keumensis]